MRPVCEDTTTASGQAPAVSRIIGVISPSTAIGKCFKPWLKMLVNLRGHRSLFTAVVGVYEAASHSG